MQHIRYASITYPILPEPKMLPVLRFSTKTVDTWCFVVFRMLLVVCWCHHHMAQLHRRLSQSKHNLFSWFFFCHSSLYARIAIQKRAQQKGFFWHNRPACEVTGALHGLENSAKMWPLFAARANVLKATLRYLKHCSLKVMNQIYMTMLFLCLNSMPVKRYWHRSDGEKRCHVDNIVVSWTAFWCIALQKHSLRMSYTFDVDVLKTRHWLEYFLLATVHHLSY